MPSRKHVTPSPAAHPEQVLESAVTGPGEPSDHWLRYRASLATLLVLVTIAVLWTHWPVLSAQAISFDDSTYLFENPLLQQPGWYAVRRFFGEVFHSSAIEGYYEPLTLTSLMLDVARGGTAENLRPFHETSLALHALNTGLIVVLLYQLFGQPSTAAVVGILFGLHPLTVEPVAWVWERKTVLATFFSLLALIAYVRYVRTRSCHLLVSHRRSGAQVKGTSPQSEIGNWKLDIKTGPAPVSSYQALGWYGLCFVSLLLALLSKPTSVPLPVLLLLLDYWPLNRLGRRAIIEKLPFFALSAASAAITIVSTGRNAIVTVPSGRSLATVPLQICYLLTFYLRKIIWPVDLSSAYTPPKPMGLSNPAVFAGLLLTAVLIVALIVSWRRTRAIITGMMFFFLALVPMLGIIGYTWMIASDKYVYLPALGLLLILTWALQCIEAGGSLRRLLTLRPLAGSAVILTIVAILGAETIGTRRYLALWKDTQTLYRHMIRVSPEAPAPHNNLAVALLDQGQIEQAIEAASEAIHLDPNQASGYINLGNAFLRQQQLDRAAIQYRAALEINPNDARAHNNLGLTLHRQARFEDAILHYTRAVQLQPEYADAHRNRGAALLKVGRFEEAQTSFQQAIRWRPNLAGAHAGMGHVLARHGRTQEALAEYARAVQLDPSETDAHQQMAVILNEQGRVGEAITHYRQAIQLEPDARLAINNLAWILATNPDPVVRNGHEAVELAERACRASEYKDPALLDTLAAAHAEAGRFAEAVQTTRTALELAGKANDPGLVTELSARLKLYESSQAYHARP